MYILPSMKVSDVENRGTEQQSAAAIYFDKNGNGIYEKEEADSFNSSKITKTDEALTITSASGYVDKYENMAAKHDDAYYESGYIPVAVIDDFTMGGEGIVQHGTMVCNTIKSINPDISITRIDTSHTQYWNSAQKFFSRVIDKYSGLEEFLYTHDKTMELCEGFFRPTKLCNKALLNALNKVQADLNSGVQYKAVNLSLAPECDYETINSLVKDEIGEEITPDNIAQYRLQIKEILRSKQDKSISFYNTNGNKEDMKIKDLFEIIDKMESLGIPIYSAGSYTFDDDVQTFSLYAFADNALICEAGVEENGEIIHDKGISHSSLSIDETTKKRRIADSRVYDGKYIVPASTSFATPMVLAQALKEKYQ